MLTYPAREDYWSHVERTAAIVSTWPCWKRGEAFAVTHLQQPARSRLCGQTCVAMLAGVTLDEAIALCERGRGVTSEHDLRRALKALRLHLWSFTRTKDLPHDTQLVRIRERRRRHGYHWIVVDGALVYDPLHEAAEDRAEYQRFMRRVGAYVTSAAPVTTGVGR